MRNWRTKLSLHLTLRGTGIAIVIRIEHRNNSDGATAIVFSPLALDQCSLHGFPVIDWRSPGTYRLKGIAVAGVIVYRDEKLSELFLQIYSHLKDKLA